ncbi:uncharacterized protein LOC113328410 [Papaver somniferum]|uniref:uncharacterized protein LOC113328410 n=1 Tax=Papaver somniferum TaxID=3469 RepID=UPI000E6F4DB3|nr:uncharacterized protein LOC113328410 [Papaver somniferum]
MENCRDWDPRFNPESQRTSLAKVWLKFPGLSLEYWTEENLLTMAKAFGKPIQVDNTTIAMEFGFFASVLVEVDFSKKIPDRVWVGEGGDDIENGFWQDAVIPKLPKKNSHYKIVGHLVSECREKLKEVVKENKDVIAADDTIKEEKEKIEEKQRNLLI